MKHIVEIGKKELQVLLYSPLGWLVLITFVIQLGSLMTSNLSFKSGSLMSISEFTPSLTFNMLFGGTISLITGISDNLYLYLPLLTMGLLSKEYSEGTIKLLLSSTVRVRDIVLGKFLSMMTLGAILVIIVGLYGLLLHFFVIVNMDLPLLFWGLLLLYLLICTYAVIGLFISSLTSYQFVAALGTVGVLFFLDYASGLSYDGMPAFMVSMLNWLKGTSFIYYFKGYVGVWDILYFILIIFLFLGLTFLKLKFMREHVSSLNKFLQYAALIAFVLGLGYISSLPFFKYYADLRNSALLDTQILIDKEDVSNWRTVLMQIIPLVFITVGAIGILRRKWR